MLPSPIPGIALLAMLAAAPPLLSQTSSDPGSGGPTAPIPAASSRPDPSKPVDPYPADHPFQPALATIAASDLRATIEWLADDERRGRCAGEPGCDAAADWIAAKFEEIGLEPLGDEGTYLQRFEFRVRGGKNARAKTQNVVGLWKGSDAALANDVIVVGAHYDHVGTIESPDAGRAGRATPTDSIWNGADDNASGTAAMLEIATALSTAKLRPKRSVVFVAFSAEEQGLFGSRWYCEHPPVPLERTTAMLNMDMVGRNPDQDVEMVAMGTLADQRWFDLVDRSRGAAPTLPFKLEPGYMPDSDHASFIDAGVPSTFVYTGEHPDYHHPSDHADKIAYDHMTDVVRFAAALTWNTAECERSLKFERPRSAGRQPKRLGVSSDGGVSASRMAQLGFGKEQGGFEVKELDPMGVGAKAGLVEGDLLLSIDGKTIDPDDPGTSVRRLIGGAPRGRDVPIVIQRGTEKRTLNARWE